MQPVTPIRQKRINGWYSRQEFLDLYKSLEELLQGANLEMKDWSTISIDNVPNLDDLSSFFALPEDGSKRVGLAILIEIGLDEYSSVTAKKRALEIYSFLEKVSGMVDCSTEYAPFDYNKGVVDENIGNPKLWGEKCGNELTMSYMPPKSWHDGYHGILIGIDVDMDKVPQEIRYLFEQIGARFNGQIYQNQQPNKQNH